MSTTIRILKRIINFYFEKTTLRKEIKVNCENYNKISNYLSQNQENVEIYFFRNSSTIISIKCKLFYNIEITSGLLLKLELLKKLNIIEYYKKYI